MRILFLALLLLAPLAVLSQTWLTYPRIRVNDGNGRGYGANQANIRPYNASDFCGIGSVKSIPTGVIYTASDESLRVNQLVYRTGNPGTSPQNALLNFDLLSYTAGVNGTVFAGTTKLNSTVPDIQPGQTNTNFWTTVTLPSLPTCANCTFRMMYIYNTTSGQTNYVSCADVAVVSRDNDRQYVVRIVKDDKADLPITISSAVNRVLGSTWATAAGLNPQKNPINAQNGDSFDYWSNSLRYYEYNAIVPKTDLEYEVRFIVSGTHVGSSWDLFQTFKVQNLNDMFGAKVVDVGQENPGVGAASLNMIMSPMIILASICMAYLVPRL